MHKENDKLDALRKREAEVKAAIAAEVLKDQKRKAKLLAREFADVGETLCKFAAQSPEFRLTLKQMLAAAISVADDATRKFLTSRGYL